MRRRRWAAGSRSGSHQPGGNRDAIGAVIETKVGDVGRSGASSSSGAGTSAASSAGRTSGLGPATEAQVRVTWPDGEVGPWMNVAANQFVDIARGATQATPWSPPGS